MENNKNNSHSLKKFLNDAKLVLIILSLVSIFLMAGAVVILALLKVDYAWIIAAGVGGTGVLVAIILMIYGINYVKKSKTYFFSYSTS